MLAVGVILVGMILDMGQRVDILDRRVDSLATLSRLQADSLEASLEALSRLSRLRAAQAGLRRDLRLDDLEDDVLLLRSDMLRSGIDVRFSR